MNWIESIRHDIAVLKTTPKQLRTFGVTIGGVLIVLSVIAQLIGWWTIGIVLMTGLCAVIGIALALVQPERLTGLYTAWMSIAIVIGSIVSRIILALIFFFILTSVAIVARIAGKEFLHGMSKKRKESMWIKRDGTKPIDYERMS